MPFRKGTSMRKLLVLFSLSLFSFSFAHQDVTLNFALKAGSESVACGQKVALGAIGSPVELLDARAYVSNLRVITESGKEIPVELTQDGIWQYETIALLDFENATGACQGTPETNTQIIGETEADEAIMGIAFTVGIPEDMNHLDAAIAPSPLNVTEMWWAWLFGYKFMRIDLLTETAMNTPAMDVGDSNSGEPSNSEGSEGTDHASEASAENGWFIHLGSTGCVGEDFVFAPDAPCANPNRIEVKLENVNPETNTVVLDLEKLLQRVDVSRSLKLEPTGCMSESTDPDCLALFTTGFGLSLKNGQQLVDSPSFFRVE
jgi:uncharacterized repeat protein (TIGR04052 family)